MVHYQRPDTRGQGKSRKTSALALSATLALAITHPLTRAHAQDGAQIQKPVIDSRSVQIQWNTGGDLEIAPSPNGPWTRVNANTSKSSRSELPLELQGHRFFRIVDNGIPGAPQPIVEGEPRRPHRTQAAFLPRAPALIALTDSLNLSRTLAGTRVLAVFRVVFALTSLLRSYHLRVSSAQPDVSLPASCSIPALRPPRPGCALAAWRRRGQP